MEMKMEVTNLTEKSASIFILHDIFFVCVCVFCTVSWNLYENIPTTSGKDLSPTTDKICAEYLDYWREK